MKKYIFLIVFSLIGIVAISQVVYKQPVKMKLDENTIVKDSLGQVYPYSVWSLLLKSKQYSFRPIDRNNLDAGFYIYKLSETEKKKLDSIAAIREANAPKPNESKFFTTGKPISPFKEKDMDGNKFSLKDMKGKVIVLNFWFVGCPPCREEIPQLNKIVDEYKDNPDVVFIAVALDEMYAIKEFLKTNPFKYHIIDNGRYIANGKYGITGYPTHAVVDKNGIVRFHTTGLGTGTVTWLKKTIDELVKEGSTVQ